MRKQNFIISILCICIFLSCSQPSNKMIFGIWVPTNNRFGTSEQLVFTKDGDMLVQSIIDSKAVTGKTLKFRISDNGKVLIVVDEGKVEQLEIIELTNSTMKLKNYKQSDTAKYIKQ